MPNCDDSRFRRVGILHQTACIYVRQIRNRNRLIFRTRTSCTRTLLLHLTVKAFIIQGNAVLMKDLLGELPRETVCVVKFESNFAIKNCLVFTFQTRDLFIQELDSLCQCGGEAIFFHMDNTLDIVLFCNKFAEILRIAENLNDCTHSSVKEGFCYPKHTPMADCTAKRAAQNVSAAFIRRQNSIHNHDRNRTCMVCNDFE